MSFVEQRKKEKKSRLEVFEREVVCVNVYLYICIHVYMYICAYMYMYTRIYLCMYVIYRTETERERDTLKALEH